MVLLLKDLIRVSLVDLSALTGELWAMLLTNVTSYMATHLGTSSRTRGSKVDILLLPAMLFPLNATMKKVSVSLNQNINNSLA